MTDNITKDIITETYNVDQEHLTGMRFTHIPSGISIQGPCNRLTQRDEYNLCNRLVETVINFSWYTEDTKYCDECGRVLPYGRRRV